ncbi:YphA family membrane protein [Paenibacillus spongiae]|uniref:Integral membrane protein n=1 Tax=Paenibacillus spongiae TaxID=2909671 RepID=A0ABY5SEH7_9BACL|nr:hypothetical protein [Paenibacillus spongiae]UVI32372.1 hypothetical protein L1F29_11370 [Paenibacillus spongiae]
MNEGFIAVWLLSIGLILFCTGWQRHVAGRISGRSVLIYLCVAAILHPVFIPVGPDIMLRGSAGWALLTAIIAVVSVRNTMQTVFVILCTMLAGTVWLWIRTMYAMDPVFILMNPKWDGPLMAGLLAGLLTDRFRYHYGIVTLAAAIAEFSSAAGRHTTVVTLGSAAWWDGVAIALITARMVWNLKTGFRRGPRRAAEGYWQRRQRGGSS